MEIKKYQLAQINIGRLRAPIDDPLIADFKNALQRINEIADNSKGFIWRLQGEHGDATDIKIDEDELLAINMSVWETLDDLMAFAYRTPDHISFVRRRHEWFEPMENYMAFWWILSGTIPSVADGFAAIESLQRNGPSAMGFSLKERIEPPND